MITRKPTYSFGMHQRVGYEEKVHDIISLIVVPSYIARVNSVSSFSLCFPSLSNSRLKFFVVHKFFRMHRAYTVDRSVLSIRISRVHQLSFSFVSFANFVVSFRAAAARVCVSFVALASRRNRILSSVINSLLQRQHVTGMNNITENTADVDDNE